MAVAECLPIVFEAVIRSFRGLKSCCSRSAPSGGDYDVSRTSDPDPRAIDPADVCRRRSLALRYGRGQTRGATCDYHRDALQLALRHSRKAVVMRVVAYTKPGTSPGRSNAWSSS